MNNTSNAGESHLWWLDQFRGLTALYVVIHHAVLNVPLEGLSGSPGYLYQGLRTIFGKGHYAVDIFIVISGYCLMLPVLRSGGLGSAASFFARRTVRIALPYYAAMIFSLALIFFFIGDKSGTHWDVSLPVSARDVWIHVFLLQHLLADSAGKINHVFWSIGVEYYIFLVSAFGAGD